MNPVNELNLNVRKIIKSVIGSNYGRIYNDKRNGGRYLKFFFADYTEVQLNQINESLKDYGITVGQIFSFHGPGSVIKSLACFVPEKE